MPVFIAATLASATVAFDRSVTRPLRDAFVDCARRTQANKERVMFLLCFAPVKRDDANGWRAVQALVARMADSLRCIKSAAHAFNIVNVFAVLRPTECF